MMRQSVSVSVAHLRSPESPGAEEQEEQGEGQAGAHQAQAGHQLHVLAW